MPKIDLASAPTRVGTGYPPPFNAPCEGRHRTKLGDAAGLTQFGVNLLRLPPAANDGDLAPLRPALREAP